MTICRICDSQDSDKMGKLKLTGPKETLIIKSICETCMGKLFDFVRAIGFKLID